MDPAQAEYMDAREVAFNPRAPQRALHAMNRRAGTVSMEYVVRHANEFLEYPICAAHREEMMRLYKPEYGALEFAYDEAQQILSAWTGSARSRTLSIKTFEAALPPNYHWTHLPPPDYAKPDTFIS